MTTMSSALQLQKVEARMAVGINDVSDYLTSHLDVDEILTKLRMGGQPGRLLSGEVCLQEAARDESNAGF